MVSCEKLRERKVQQYISDLFKLKKFSQNLIYRLFKNDFSDWKLLFSRYCLELFIIRKEKKGGEEEIFLIPQ